jgi:acetyl esterase/lipase
MASVPMRVLSVWLRVCMKPRVATAERARARMAKPKDNPEPPASLRRRHQVSVRTVGGFPCYTVTPRSVTTPARALVYLHGGAYVSEITRAHWRFISRLADAGCQAEVPIYGLAPQHTYRDAFPAITAVHQALLDRFDPQAVAWAGDSAGGGLALAVAQTLPDAGLAMPARLILLSPWLDITMSNPGIAEIAPQDPWLSPAGLMECGRAWAGGDDPHDPRLSPINGPVDGLPLLDLFAGTAEIFRPDIRLLAQRATDAGIPVRLTEAGGAFHVYPLAPVPEARIAIDSIVHALAGLAPTR